MAAGKRNAKINGPATVIHDNTGGVAMTSLYEIATTYRADAARPSKTSTLPAEVVTDTLDAMAARAGSEGAERGDVCPRSTDHHRRHQGGRGTDGQSAARP